MDFILMYFIEYDKETGAAIGCINFEDKTKALVSITEEQYISFIDGINNIVNYHVLNGELREIRRAHLSTSPCYKTTQLTEIQSTTDPDIEISVSGGNVRLLAHAEITITGITNLYITLKNNPTRFEEYIQVDLAKLQQTKELTFEIPSIIKQQISIYTTNNKVKFGLNNE